MYALDDLSRTYRQGDRTVEALAGVSLEIGAGEHVSITGPSGSGKTTLLQLLGALDRPTGGTLRFDGADVAGMADKQLTALRLSRLGFVFQQFNLVPTLSARANVEAALDPLRLGRRERRARATARLDDVGLAGRAGHLPSQLSGGEQQRVAIARALATEPAVVLADEPTGNLDRASADVVADLLASLAGEHGRTVVVVTHDPELAARAPRVVRLADGRVGADERGGRHVSGLRAVELRVGDVAAAERWYAETLGVSVQDGVVTLGRAGQLRLAQGQGGATVVLETLSDAGRIVDPWGNIVILES
ncbi:MAG: putative transport system ATP-binding protein [Solirubrobacteraceae bacterium]|jgi:putative ABC transport system ATP-binding protein|nr:putative transport system ATP-binding protein [Solirubrobacteraceae bacterium]